MDDTAVISINEFRAKTRCVMLDLGSLTVIGVDYLQLMRSTHVRLAGVRSHQAGRGHDRPALSLRLHR
ncbi:hypothetical protein [Akkermansia muciniphila]|uniref:hypothetical protein n=1 Tax=Akkermansia muciniphila TaxID=239935 RepID=UPI003F7FDB3A